MMIKLSAFLMVLAVATVRAQEPAWPLFNMHYGPDINVIQSYYHFIIIIYLLHFFVFRDSFLSLRRRLKLWTPGLRSSAGAERTKSKFICDLFNYALELMFVVLLIVL